jgi:hypothetical protein
MADLRSQIKSPPRFPADGVSSLRSEFQINKSQISDKMPERIRVAHQIVDLVGVENDDVYQHTSSKSKNSRTAVKSSTLQVMRQAPIRRAVSAMRTSK